MLRPPAFRHGVPPGTVFRLERREREQRGTGTGTAEWRERRFSVVSGTAGMLER
jgi:hypothetical protein